MAARLHRAKATLEIGTPGAEQTLACVSISVRLNIATVRLGTDVLVTRENVAKVVPLGRRTWQLEFDGAAAGDVWTITDEHRACCGRR